MSNKCSPLYSDPQRVFLTVLSPVEGDHSELAGKGIELLASLSLEDNVFSRPQESVIEHYGRGKT